jgi:hypothetical protein
MVGASAIDGAPEMLATIVASLARPPTGAATRVASPYRPPAGPGGTMPPAGSRSSSPLSLLRRISTSTIAPTPAATSRPPRMMKSSEPEPSSSLDAACGSTPVVSPAESAVAPSVSSSSGAALASSVADGVGDAVASVDARVSDTFTDLPAPASMLRVAALKPSLIAPIEIAPGAIGALSEEVKE